MILMSNSETGEMGEKQPSSAGVDVSEMETCEMMEDDVLIAAYPGTDVTLAAHLVSLFRAGLYKFDETMSRRVADRFVSSDPGDGPSNLQHKLDQRRRPVASHQPYSCLSKWVEKDNVKTIVLMQNPKDAGTALYHHYSLTHTTNWSDFFARFTRGELELNDQLLWLESWYKVKDRKNVIFVQYDDLLENLNQVIAKLCQLFVTLITDQHFVRLMHKGGLSGMVDQPDLSFLSANVEEEKCDTVSVSRGEWKCYFTDSQREWFDDRFNTDCIV